MKLNDVNEPFYLSTNSQIVVKFGPLDSELPDLECRPLKNYKATNAWQSLAYNPLGTVVSPPSEYL